MATKILIPRLSVNDDTVAIGEWLVKNGDHVEKGQDIVVFETTKETVEGQAEADGIIHIIVEQGEEKEVGFCIGMITSDDEMNVVSEEYIQETDTRKYTAKAKKLIEKYEIDVSILPTDRIIREKDVESLVKKPLMIRQYHTNDVFIYGGGGLAKVIIDILKQTCAYNLTGIVDTRYPKLGKIGTTNVLGNDEYLDELISNGITKAINAVNTTNATGTGKGRAYAYDKLKAKGFELPNLIHKTAFIEPTVTMGEGNLIMSGAMLGSDVVIGNDCVINVNAVVNHDCVISDTCHIASGAILAGGVTVGENTLIGQGCTIFQRVKIGNNVVIQNGCHVFKDVPDGTVVK